MTKRKKNSTRRFVLGMLIYALVFIVFLAIGLRIFWGYIDSYEKSQPVHAIDSYIESFDSEHIRSLCGDFVGSLDHRLQSEEDAYTLIESLFNGRLRYSKNSVESTEDRLVYAIVSDNRMLGTMALNRSGEGNNSVWTVSDEKFDFSDLLGSAEILAPSEWQISCNGNTLGEDFVTETGIRYPSMEEAYDFGFELPTLVTPVVLLWYILTELGSITENAEKMGAPVPQWVKNGLKQYRDRLERENGRAGEP